LCTESAFAGAGCSLKAKPVGGILRCR